MLRRVYCKVRRAVRLWYYERVLGCEVIVVGRPGRPNYKRLILTPGRRS